VLELAQQLLVPRARLLKLAPRARVVVDEVRVPRLLQDPVLILQRESHLQ